MKKYFFLLIIMLVLFINCNTDKNEVIKIQFDKFPLEKKIYASKQLEVNDVIEQICVYDSFIITCNRYEPFFSKYNKTNLQYVESSGKKGKGPGEYIQPFLYNLPIKYKESNVVLINDRALKSLSFLNPKEMYKSNYLPIKKIQIQPLIELTKKPLYIDDEHILCYSGFQLPGKINNLNSYTEKFETLYQFMPEKQKMELDYQIYYSEGTWILHPDKNKIAYLYLCNPQLDIYSYNNNKIKLVSSTTNTRLPFAKYNNMKEFLNNTPSYYLSFVATSTKYIYCIFVNETVNTLYKTIGYQNFKPHLHVYDWNGNPICDYELDNSVEEICYDEKSKVLYGVLNYKTTNLYMYNLEF